MLFIRLVEIMETDSSLDCSMSDYCFMEVKSWRAACTVESAARFASLPLVEEFSEAAAFASFYSYRAGCEIA